MRYCVPARTSVVTTLCSPHLSLLAPTTASVATVDPRYMASAVSNELPQVSICSCPVNGEVHENQIDAPPSRPAWKGSPSSTVAPTLLAMTVPASPVIGSAAAKASLDGGAAWASGTPTSASDIAATIAARHSPRLRFVGCRTAKCMSITLRLAGTLVLCRLRLTGR